ncbi:MAG: SAM-dependent methyltransferase [Bacteroidetes bacterium]|nr:MAG: SAM-dependent methyltransferase [Bacteroidota bacterium]
MDMLHSVSRYLRYRLLGLSPHGIHSPFVFDLLNKVILDETPYYFYEDIEALRSRLLLDNRTISVTDFGTGGSAKSTRKLKVSGIAKNFLQRKKNAQLISRLVTHFKPKSLLELGTSLGLTSAYMALPNRQTQVITVEGCSETAAIARHNFELLGIKNIELICGEFNQGLPLALDKTGHLDFVYFDGNHKKEATLKYFESCLKQHSESSVFIFDDIHWSREMSDAWTQIKNNPEVTLSLDLFQLGIVFFRKGIPKQHFILKF